MRITATAALLSVCSVTYAASPVCTHLLESYNDDGSVKSIVPCNENCRHAPVWDGMNGEPPLSIGQAVAVALEWARQKHGNDVTVSSISLMPYGCAGEKQWDYWVHVGPPLKGDTVVVLMDGTVAERKEVEKKKK